METIIDGYNVMHARGLMNRAFGPDGLRRARRRFLADLAAALDPIAAGRTTVVFDASQPPPDRPTRERVAGITVLFAVGDEDADARIEAMIAAHSAPRNLTVVSTDRHIRRAAERRKARALTSDEFLSSLANRGRPGAVAANSAPAAPRRGPSDDESAHWMEVFADVDLDARTAEALDPARALLTDEEIAEIERQIRDES